MKKSIVIDVKVTEQKVSAKSGSTYYLVSGWAHLGGKYPEAFTQFSDVPLQPGEYDMPVSIEVDRNKNLSLKVDFNLAIPLGAK